jgi:hypothetical protein
MCQIELHKIAQDGQIVVMEGMLDLVSKSV